MKTKMDIQDFESIVSQTNPNLREIFEQAMTQHSAEKQRLLNIIYPDMSIDSIIQLSSNLKPIVYYIILYGSVRTDHLADCLGMMIPKDKSISPERYYLSNVLNYEVVLMNTKALNMTPQELILWNRRDIYEYLYPFNDRGITRLVNAIPPFSNRHELINNVIEIIYGKLGFFKPIVNACSNKNPDQVSSQTLAYGSPLSVESIYCLDPVEIKQIFISKDSHQIGKLKTGLYLSVNDIQSLIKILDSNSDINAYSELSYYLTDQVIPYMALNTYVYGEATRNFKRAFINLSEQTQSTVISIMSNLFQYSFMMADKINTGKYYNIYLDLSASTWTITKEVMYNKIIQAISEIKQNNIGLYTFISDLSVLDYDANYGTFGKTGKTFISIINDLELYHRATKPTDTLQYNRTIYEIFSTTLFYIIFFKNINISYELISMHIT